MLNVMFVVVACVVGIPIVICASHVCYEFITDIIERR